MEANVAIEREREKRETFYLCGSEHCINKNLVQKFRVLEGFKK